MAKESLSLVFLNSAGGDQFDQSRKFLGPRSPDQFATRLIEALASRRDLIGFAEVPEMGDRDPTGIKRSAFLNAVARGLGNEFKTVPQPDIPVDRMQATLGLALVSRLLISNIELLFIEPPVEDNYLTHPKGALKVKLEQFGREIDLAIVHYHPLHIVRAKRAFSEDEMAAIDTQIEGFTRFLTPRTDESYDRVPTVVIGDFNTHELNQPATTLVENLLNIGYIETLTDPTIPGSAIRRADRLFVTPELSVEEVSLFNADSDHYGISALVVSI